VIKGILQTPKSSLISFKTCHKIILGPALSAPAQQKKSAHFALKHFAFFNNGFYFLILQLLENANILFDLFYMLSHYIFCWEKINQILKALSSAELSRSAKTYC
jgi:hypothetical protein